MATLNDISISFLTAWIAISSESNLTLIASISDVNSVLNAWMAVASESACLNNSAIAAASESASILKPAIERESESVAKSNNWIRDVSESRSASIELTFESKVLKEVPRDWIAISSESSLATNGASLYVPAVKASTSPCRTWILILSESNFALIVLISDWMVVIFDSAVSRSVWIAWIAMLSESTSFLRSAIALRSESARPVTLLLIILTTSSLSINLETVLPPRVKSPCTVSPDLILKSLVAIYLIPCG